MRSIRLRIRPLAVGACLSTGALFTVAGCASVSTSSAETSTSPAAAGPGAPATPASPGSPATSAVPANRPEKPIPYPVVPSRGFRDAVEDGTRTMVGAPGPEYWQQWASYDIDARVDTDAKRVEGRTRIVYHNNSPVRLNSVFIMLYQNLHAEGVPRLVPTEVTGGMAIEDLVIDGVAVSDTARRGARYRVNGTLMWTRLVNPLQPGDSVEIDIGWAFDLSSDGASGRMGWNSDNFVYLAYWYPQMAVYDDVIDWHSDQFTGRAEFYAGFGDYDVSLDVPEGWVVMGTGTLQNREEVLPASVLARLRTAEGSDDIVHVLTADDFGPGKATTRGENGRLTWHFRADKVRDVAFSVTRESLWDATRTPVGDLDGDGDTDYARIDAFYRQDARHWVNAARYGQHSIDFLSRFTGFSYPWPHMTIVEGGGIIGGGMEYPMMTLIGDYNARGDEALYAVTAHELAHMWVPMAVSNDETRWAWMDEGTTSFNENNAKNEFYPGNDHNLEDQRIYMRAAQGGGDDSMMRWTDWTYPQAWGIDAYQKPATMLFTLRGLLGDSVFIPAYHDYIRTWAYKHPKPWDFFNHFDTAAGEDLSWFWRSWYYENWLMDQAISAVTTEPDGTRIVVENVGHVPMPVRLTITREDGEVITRELPVDVWLTGAAHATMVIPPGAAVVEVAIDAEGAFPDVDRENNVWKSES